MNHENPDHIERDLTPETALERLEKEHPDLFEPGGLFCTPDDVLRDMILRLTSVPPPPRRRGALFVALNDLKNAVESDKNGFETFLLHFLKQERMRILLPPYISRYEKDDEITVFQIDEWGRKTEFTRLYYVLEGEVKYTIERKLGTSPTPVQFEVFSGPRQFVGEIGLFTHGGFGQYGRGEITITLRANSPAKLLCLQRSAFTMWRDHEKLSSIDFSYLTSAHTAVASSLVEKIVNHRVDRLDELSARAGQGTESGAVSQTPQELKKIRLRILSERTIKIIDQASALKVDGHVYFSLPTDREIGEELGCSHHTIRADRKHLKIQAHGNEPTPWPGIPEEMRHRMKEEDIESLRKDTS